jgi:hypothetical protein
MDSPENLSGEVDRCPGCGVSVRVPADSMPAAPPILPAQDLLLPPFIAPPPVPQYKLREAKQTWLTRQSTGLIAAAVFFLGACAMLGVGLRTDDEALELLGGVLGGCTVLAFLGGIPGMIARKRKAENYTAINVLGYVGVFVLFLPWIAALIWACADATEPG